MYLKELPYYTNNKHIITKFTHLPWTVCLDSCHPHTDTGRFDIICTKPEICFSLASNKTTSKSDVLTSLNAYLQSFSCDKNIDDPRFDDIPFCGGAIGLINYDFARQIEKLPTISKDDVDFPSLLVGIYAWAIVTDHLKQKTFFVSCLSDKFANKKFNEIQALLTSPQPKHTPFSITHPFQSNMTYETYQNKLQKILQCIHDGECYEINFAQRFKANFTGDPITAYHYLSKYNPAPFSAFMRTPFGDVISCSPERFLKVKHQSIETKPIKGTRPRGKTPSEDRALAKTLLNSEKDHAENLMIVDLMRNDLSKVCKPHSIKVPKLCALESFANVHHLVSTIQGELQQNITLKDIILATFPGGSITGAPKIRAMEIIDELEPHRRNAYCGSLFYYDIRGRMDSNILIRTLLCHDNDIYVYGGGAIVADSNSQEEFAECYAKVGNIIKLLESIAFL